MLVWTKPSCYILAQAAIAGAESNYKIEYSIVNFIFERGNYTFMPTNRATLGFLFANLHTGASLVIWPSMLRAAELHDVNLICFPGGRLQAVDSFEVQRNAIFSLVNDRCLDGLITWSSSDLPLRGSA